jgi:hypothetical protein
MKPYILIVIISLGITLITCEEKNTNQEYLFEAKVLGRNTDCGLFAIQLTKNIQLANEIAGTLYTEYTFIAKNLPADLQVDGVSIILNMRRIKDSELGICTAMGPSYPWIYVLEAKIK